jgi:hypothetical protein
MSVKWHINIDAQPPGFEPQDLTLDDDQVLVLTWNGATPVKITFVDPQPKPMPTLDREPFWMGQCNASNRDPFSVDSPGMDFTLVPEGTYEIEADDGGVGRMTGKLTVTKPGS